jgi:ParB family chromosome partitioning protein
MSTLVDPKRKALGRGLESLLPSKNPSSPLGGGLSGAQGARELPVSEIDPNPYQTRQQVDEQALNELADSIRANGVLQPIVVRPVNGRYQLVAGERRWLACRRANREFIPAVVRQLSNQQALELTIVENLQREDLNPMEQARAFDRLGREFGLTQEQIAERTGKPRSAVANFTRLMKLPEPVQQMVEGNVLSFGHAKVLLVLETPESILQAAEKVRASALSVRQTEELVQRLLRPPDMQTKDAKPQQSVDPNVRAAQDELQRALGMRVTIRDNKGKGKVTIEYASLEDLDRIVEVLGK